MATPRSFARFVHAHRPRSATPRHRLTLEALEDRLLLATRIWDGNALSNNWSNAFNWDHDTLPVPGDNLVFPAGSFNDDKVADNDFTAGFLVNSITFAGSGFTVKGNRINLGAGGVVDSSGSSNRLKNDINLTGSRTFNIGQGSTLFLDGVITGGSASTITKTGAGDLSFEAQNSYFGPTVVSQGRLFGKKDTSLGLGGAGTTVNAGATLLIIDTVFGTMHVDEPISVASEGVLRVLGSNELQGNLSFDTDAAFSVEGPTDVTGNTSFYRSGLPSNSGSIFNATISVDSRLKFHNSVTLQGGITRFTGLGEVEYAGVIQGPGGLYLNVGFQLFDGTGEGHAVKFTGSSSNTYQGGTTVSSTVASLAKAAGAIAIPTGTFRIAYGYVRLHGHEQISSGTQVLVDGTQREEGLDLNGFDNTIASLTVQGNGQVRSASLVRNGVLTVLDQIVGSQLEPERRATLSDHAYPLPEISCDLYVGSTLKNVVVENETLLVSGKITGTGSGAGITKSGTGTLVLTANNTYLGNTVVSAGNLRLHGNQALSKAFVTGGRLLGTGTVGGLTVQAGGRVKPGSVGGFGILHVAGDVSFLPGSVLEVSLNGPIAGSGYDQIDVDGPGTTGLGSGIVRFDGAIAAPFVGLGNAIGDTFKVIDNDDSDVPLNDTFASSTQASVPQGGVLIAPGGENFQVNYRGGTNNNDVIFTRVTAGALFPNRSVTAEITEGGYVKLTGTVKDPDRGDTFFLNINWGDGSPIERKVYPPKFNGHQVQILHRYSDNSRAANGEYTIKLEWHDQYGAGNSGTMTTRVVNAVPWFAPVRDVTVRAGAGLRQLLCFIDPGKDRWTVTVDFGDGTVPRDFQVTNRLHLLPVTHRYQEPGQYTVTATVRDDDGGIGTTSFAVNVLSRVVNTRLADLVFSLLATTRPAVRN